MPGRTFARYLVKKFDWLCCLLHTKKPKPHPDKGVLTTLPQSINADRMVAEFVPIHDLIAIPEQYFRRLILEPDSLGSILSVIGTDASFFKTISNIYAIYRANDALCELNEYQKTLVELTFEFMPELEGKESILLDILCQPNIIDLPLNASIHEGDSLLISLIRAVKNPQFSSLSIYSVSGNQRVFDFLANVLLRHFGPIQFADFANHLNIEDPTDLLSENDIFERVANFISHLSETDKESLIPHLNGSLRRQVIEEDLCL